MSSDEKVCKRLMVHELSSDFRKAVVVETSKICTPKENEVCVKNKYVGVNATDINITKGRYLGGRNLPFPTGLDGVGEIVNIGSEITDLKVGQFVAYRSTLINAYSEYVCLPAGDVHLIPDLKPEYLAFTVCGLTAAVGLDKAGRICAKDTVLITAAAGGTGHIAVQWAKAADCHVIGTCSNEEKMKILKDLGCDRVINYKKENLDEVLSKEYKNGIDVIWETIGGQVLETCIKHLAVKGRLVIVGGISGYKSEDQSMVPKIDLSNLPAQLLMKSATISGFRILAFKDCYPSYFKYLTDCLEKGQIRTLIDNGLKSTGQQFKGMEGIIKGVEHLHSGKSIGKIVVQVS